jgi:Flp pilus assembly protein TadD
MRRTVSIAAILVCSVILATRCGAQSSARPPLSPAQRAASDPRVYQAQQETEKKNYAKAVELLTSFLKDYPNDATAHFELGYVYGLLKRSDDSLSEYRRAAELKPNFAEAYLNMGLAMLEAKDYPGAASALERAAELMPGKVQPRYLAGLARERSGNFAAAISQYELAASLDAKDFDIVFHLGIALLHEDRGEEAEHRLREAIALRSGNEAAHAALIDALLRQKKTDAAIVTSRMGSEI